MKVLLISQVFYPDEVSTASLLTELTTELVNNNDIDVEVWCAQPSYTTNIRQRKCIIYNNIKIKYLCSTNFYKDSKIGRLINYLSFSISLFLKLLLSKNKSLILTVTNPPFLGMIITFVKKIRKKKFIYIIHDIYPDGLVKLNLLKENSLVVKLWRKLNKWVLKNAEKIIVIGRDMEEAIYNYFKITTDNIIYIPNWQNESFIKQINFRKSRMARKNFSNDSFVIQYSGNMGIWHDMKTIGKAIEQYKNNEVMFCFIGDGQSKKDIIGIWDGGIPNNVKFFPFQPRENLADSLSACHVALISLKKNLEGIAVPCKLYGILASGRAVIAQVPQNSEVALVVKEENCGIVVKPGNSEELIKAIESLYNNKKLCNEMGRNARKAFETKYTTKIITQKYYNLIKECQ